MIKKEDLQLFIDPSRVLVRSNDYVYLLPHPVLHNWISNYTITFPNKHIISDHYTVIPHGSATVVFGIDEKGGDSYLFGPSTKPCFVGNDANQHSMLLIIEFQPAGLYRFTGMVQKELTDHKIPFEAVHSKLYHGIADIIERAHTPLELITQLDELLLLSQGRVSPCELTHAAQMIIQNSGTISQKELSGEVYYSERHLNRIFDQHIGMNTKTFSRMVRINKAIRLLQNPKSSICYVSDVMGFYDLSHFVHDFKAICGMTPQTYRNHMSDVYSEIAKF